MGKTVIIAEKPSVGRDIARVIGCKERGDGCLIGEKAIVTWAVGHLVTLQEPDELDERYKKWRAADLPILPDHIPLKVIRSSASQFKIVKQLINAPETDALICATDAGREGELIFRYIYQQAKCVKPFRRLWISSMTDGAIKEGFRSLKDGSAFDGLFRSAQCRSVADWLVGMNATRAFSIRYNARLSVGRVQTPTLALLVKRRKEIENFHADPYWTLNADFGDYRGMYFVDGAENDTRIATKEEADALAARLKGKTATVQSVETTRKQDAPPQLYDLTSLQRDANQLLGFTAKKTLALAQTLYEKHKALTYPRTDSRYLPEDMVPRAEQTLRMLPQSYQSLVPLALREGKLHPTKRTVDGGKVSDHHALIPTAQRVRPESFEADERALYDLVVRRMIAAFAEPMVYDATRVITEADGALFRSTGRVILQEGWKQIPPLEKPMKSKKTKTEADDENASLPPLQSGDTRSVKKLTVKESATKPPQPYTDGSLLLAMERAGKEVEDDEIARQMKGSGLGTPATRAAIIERLLTVGYAERVRKTLVATDKGVQLIEIMPESIASPALTGQWEMALDRITDGRQDADAFMHDIRGFAAELTAFAGASSKTVVFPREERGKARSRSTVHALAGCLCPVCKQGEVLDNPKSFGCSRWREGCAFTLWKDMLQKEIHRDLNEQIIRMLLEKGSVQGSTGTIRLQEGQISFTPSGWDHASFRKSIEYQKKQNR